jgi:transcription elongation factor Elf1
MGRAPSIKEQRKGRKVSTTLNTFCCMGCRKARPAAGGFADCTITVGRATLTALCDHCGTLLNNPVAKSQIP